MKAIGFLMAVFGFVFFTSLAYGMNGTTVQMLNKDADGNRMVYSTEIVEIGIGQTVKWIPTDKGHNVEFKEMPKGVKKFKSKVNKDAEYNFKIPGIYLYICTPHIAMGMIGLVVVGNDLSNLEDIKKVKMRGKSKKIFRELLKEL